MTTEKLHYKDEKNEIWWSWGTWEIDEQAQAQPLEAHRFTAKTLLFPQKEKSGFGILR